MGQSGRRSPGTTVTGVEEAANKPSGLPPDFRAPCGPRASGRLKPTGTLPPHLLWESQPFRPWKVRVGSYSGLKETCSETGFGWQKWKACDKYDSHSPTHASALNV